MTSPGTPPPRPSGEGLEWVSPHTPESDAEMATRDLARVRLLHQLRRPLPLDDATRRRTGGSIEVRAFRPGTDDDAWLRVNNRAFAWHPDQGGWDQARLRARLSEPWVELEGFLVHDGPTGELDGFCWTKRHPRDDATGEPAMGEIFVIAADPATHGTGLGRGLVIAGLDWLAGQGDAIGMLYTEADNEPAMRLYSKLGFTVHHSDAGYAPVA